MRFVLLAVIAALVLVNAPARAEFIYGVTDPTFGPTTLVRFDSATPGTLTTIGPISGIVAGQTLRGIDFRPSNGQLYALSSGTTLATAAAAQLYTINLATGASAAVGGGLALTGNTSGRVSLDFNPVVDALRVVTGTGQNYRVNANTGALINQDSNINPGGTLISGIAYTNNVPGTTQTTLYAYDFNLDNVFTIGGLNGVPSPNTGTLNLVGASGVPTFNAALGFDISGASGIGYISVDDGNTIDDETEFYRVNLGSGAMTQVGDFNAVILDISVATTAVPAPPAVVAVLTGLITAGGYARIRRRRPMAEAAA